MLRKVSVIVPVYNMGIYVEACLKSLIEQTYDNLEILIIDNNSTDNSVQICKRYGEIDSRITIISEGEKGVSNARNKGIKSATGEFIAFVDSDDIIEKNHIEKLVNGIACTDMCICNYNELYKTESVRKIAIKADSIISNKEAIQQIFGRDGYGGYLWNKLFKMDIIKKYNISFDKNIHMCEDMLFVINYLQNSKSIHTIPDVLYNYRMRKSSTVWDKEEKKYNTLIDSYNKIYEILKIEDINTILFEYQVLNSVYSRKKTNLQKKLVIDINQAYKKIMNDDLIMSQNKKKLFMKKNIGFIYNKYMKMKINKLKLYD